MGGDGEGGQGSLGMKMEARTVLRREAEGRMTVTNVLVHSDGCLRDENIREAERAARTRGRDRCDASLTGRGPSPSGCAQLQAPAVKDFFLICLAPPNKVKEGK